MSTLVWMKFEKISNGFYIAKLNQHLKECEWRWIHSPPTKNQSKKDQEKYKTLVKMGFSLLKCC